MGEHLVPYDRASTQEALYGSLAAILRSNPGIGNALYNVVQKRASKYYPAVASEPGEPVADSRVIENLFDVNCRLKYVEMSARDRQSLLAFERELIGDLQSVELAEALEGALMDQPLPDTATGTPAKRVQANRMTGRVRAFDD